MSTIMATDVSVRSEEALKVLDVQLDVQVAQHGVDLAIPRGV